MNVFELQAVIELNNQAYEQGLKDAESKSSNIASNIGKGFANMAKITATAIAAASAAVGVLVKKSVDAYANYEQLVGGVQTLFGEISTTGDASAKVMENAANAYKTAGISANQYMEQVTSFSASLMNSLDNDAQKSADVADMAIRDMADNANKMGTSMESIQNAYQGFAKQNYTMLDNLKLGYGGTKEEMQRLLKDAKELTGVEYDISNLSDVYEAIHVIQGELGVTGTTAKEAATTISGSVSSMKAAWTNLITGMGDANSNLPVLFAEFEVAAETAFDNILPVVQRALEGVSSLIRMAVPKIAKTLPPLIKSTLPDMLAAGVELLMAVANGIMQALPAIMETMDETIQMVIDAIIEALPTVLEAGAQIVVSIASGILNNLPKIVDAGAQLITKMANSLSNGSSTVASRGVEIVTKLAQTIINNIPQIISAGLTLLKSLATGILQAIPTIIAALPTVINSLIDTLLSMIPEIIETGVELLTALIDNLPAIIQAIVAAIPQIISGIVTAFMNNIGAIIDAGVDLFMAILTGLPTVLQAIGEAVPTLISKIGICIAEAFPSLVQWGKNLINKLLDGIKEMWEKLVSWVDGAVQKLKSKFNITAKMNIDAYVHGSSSHSSTSTHDNKKFHTARGGVVKKGQLAFLEGDGAEAVVPLENDAAWISKVAKDMNTAIGVRSESSDAIVNELRAFQSNFYKDMVAALSSVEIDWNDRNLGRLVQTYA